jgi:peroxiredoxin
LAGVGVTLQGAGTSKRRIMLRPGDAAPDFELPDLNDRTVELSDLRGQTVVLFNFSSW